MTEAVIPDLIRNLTERCGAKPPKAIRFSMTEAVIPDLTYPSFRA